MPERRIEFIGDSYTVGYGNSPMGIDNEGRYGKNGDNYYTYAAYTARHYNAEYQIVAYSGKGAYVNYQGTIVSEIKMNKDSIISDISNCWNKLHPEKQIHPKIFFSPMPSGASVICDEKIFSEIIRPQHRKCVGLDMETYGVYFSIQNTSRKQIEFFSIKCVSDYADIEKNDDYHEVSCYISANFLAKFIEMHK